MKRTLREFLRLWLTDDSDRHPMVRLRPVAELAAAVPTPAIRQPAGCKAAGVLPAGTDRGERQAAGHGDRNRAVGGRSITELAPLVESPAVRDPAGRQAATALAGADRAEAQPTGDRNRRTRIRRGAVAELAVRVAAPAVGRSSRSRPTRIRRAGTDRGER